LRHDPRAAAKLELAALENEHLENRTVSVPIHPTVPLAANDIRAINNTDIVRLRHDPRAAAILELAAFENEHLENRTVSSGIQLKARVNQKMKLADLTAAVPPPPAPSIAPSDHLFYGTLTIVIVLAAATVICILSFISRRVDKKLLSKSDHDDASSREGLLLVSSSTV
jgi:hypothetical protein